MKRFRIVLNLLLSMAGCLALLCGVALADTDGTELKVVDNPQTLTIQHGPDWAGQEFELRTDAGKYPGVVTVNPSVILEMELSDSRFFTLSCMDTGKKILKEENQEKIEIEIEKTENTVETEKGNGGMMLLLAAAVAVATGALFYLYRKAKKTG